MDFPIPMRPTPSEILDAYMTAQADAQAILVAFERYGYEVADTFDSPKQEPLLNEPFTYHLPDDEFENPGEENWWGDDGDDVWDRSSWAGSQVFVGHPSYRLPDDEEVRWEDDDESGYRLISPILALLGSLMAVYGAFLISAAAIWIVTGACVLTMAVVSAMARE